MKRQSRSGRRRHPRTKLFKPARREVQLHKTTIDMRGMRIGDLYVFGLAERRKNRQARFACVCLTCDTIVIATGDNLRRHKQTSCRACSYKPPKRQRKRRR